MKRVSQYVAVMVIALLAGLPAVEGLACSKHMASRAAACTMGAAEMGPDCPMGRELASCEMECCSHSAPQVAAAWATAVKPKAVAISTVVATVLISASVTAAPAGRSMDPAPAASPPRYVLNRVFRI
ncbi:MAG TPA: hypothetical protein VKB38_19545 [Terracidiphilus sp.]|nr:hypothetical protein [Terracidiphilus sp.]